MKNLLKIALAAVAVCAGATACRTNEPNYRAAYEKTIAGRDAGVPLDSSVYGKVRRQMTVTMLSAGGDSAELRAIPVNPTPAPDGTPGAIPQPYGIVAGQFKTLFNARSLCDRLHETGYTEASIVQTAEPYYYIVASWQPDGATAIAAMRRLQAEAPVAMREPVPFILKTSVRRP